MSTGAASDSLAGDIRPVIATGARGEWGVWVFGIVLLLGGFMLYSALSASEESAEVPAVFAPQDDGRALIASPPALRMPERFSNTSGTDEEPEPQDPAAPSTAPQRLAPALLQPIAPAFAQLPPMPRPLDPSPQDQTTPREEAAPRVVFDASATAGARAPATATGAARGESPERVLASRLANPSRTIPQGTVIQAVLETALDSTRAGGVRALVQRDVSSFDGTRVLIPRGSRLYGEYEANLQAGQNRALVQWTRLIRPDGVTIALDSPSSDPLGRAGIRGRVDTKFLQRFGGALLQSVLDIGVGVAVNEASNGVIVALPGSTQNVQVRQPDAVQPTLKVRHGTSVSVFVARDLDFSSVDR